jgi:hypothetical protein
MQVTQSSTGLGSLLESMDLSGSAQAVDNSAQTQSFSEAVSSAAEKASSAVQADDSSSVPEQSAPTSGTPGTPIIRVDPSPAAFWPVYLIPVTEPNSLAEGAKSALAGSLKGAGIDPSQVKTSYWEEIVYSWFGNYINKNITVETPNGRKMDFDAAATARNPEITACAVQRMWNAEGDWGINPPQIPAPAITG